MFYDLNIPVSAAAGSAAAAQEQLETKKRVELLVHCNVFADYGLSWQKRTHFLLPSIAASRVICAYSKNVLRQLFIVFMIVGYQVVAYNHEVVGKLPPQHVNPIQKLDLPGVNLKQLSRLTLVVDDMSQNYGLNASNQAVSSYDLVAVQPTNEKLFQAACSTFEVDIISLDMSARLPFYLKHSTVGIAIERGIYFELGYSAAIRDANARRNLISNAQSLIRVTRGKNIILTSQAIRAMELRGPYDIINFGGLLGLNQAIAKECISAHCRAVMLHAETRRNTIRAVISITPAASLAENEQWRLGNKRKKDNQLNKVETQASKKAKGVK